MSDLNDLSRPVTTDTEPNVLDTLRAHLVRAATWTGWSATANKVAGLMSAVTAGVSGGRSLRLYRRNDANTADEEVISLPGMSVGGNAATASAAQTGSALETALAAKAPLSSPALTGTPTAPTAAAGTNTTQIANTAFVATAVANLVQSAPAALDTLNELATSLGNDPNFASTMTTALGNRVLKTSANRPGVTRLYRRDDDSDYSVQINWTGARWRLAGYNADTYHAGAEVQYADVAGNALSISSAVGVAYGWSARQEFLGGGETWTDVTQGKVEVRSLTGGAAFMSFHRQNVFATYFGLDTDNQFKWGGWSAGGPYTFWTTANFDPTTKLGVSAQAASAAYAVTDNQHFGISQTWQTVTGSRSIGTTYYNTTSRPIEVRVSVTAVGSEPWSATLTIGGVGIASPGAHNNWTTTVQGVVPPGAAYSVSIPVTLSSFAWAELR